MSRRRRRNPISTGTKIGLSIGAGIAVGAAVGYFVANTRAGQRLVEQSGLETWRLPDPSFRVHLPVTEEDFGLLEQVICECGAAIVEAAPENSPLEGVVDEVRLCVAKELHPDFAWPPVPLDHPSATQLWAELAVLVRAAIVTGSICEAVWPTPQPIPIPGVIS
jgi:hypothetical protein